MKPGEFRILYVLMNARDGLTFTELKNVTGLSHTALSNYLTNELKMGMVIKDSKTRRYQIPVGFCKASPLLEEFDKKVATLMADIPFHGSLISTIGLGNKELGNKLFKEFLEDHVNYLAAIILFSIRKAIVTSIESVKYPKLGQRKKSYVMGQEIIKTMEKQIDQLHASLKGWIDNWIGPYIHFLALAYSANEIREEIGLEVTRKFLDASRNKRSWVNTIRDEWEALKKEPKIGSRQTKTV